MREFSNLINNVAEVIRSLGTLNLLLTGAKTETNFNGETNKCIITVGFSVVDGGYFLCTKMFKEIRHDGFEVEMISSHRRYITVNFYEQ